MRKLATAFLYLVSLATAAAPQSFFGDDSDPGPRRWGPNGNGTLDHYDDLRWVALRHAKVIADDAKGEYNATFTDIQQKMDGREFDITGYMLPVESTTHSAHFILTRRSAGCPFCPPNEPTEAIEVFAMKPVDYTQAPLNVQGRLHLVRKSISGLFYRLDRAETK